MKLVMAPPPPEPTPTYWQRLRAWVNSPAFALLGGPCIAGVLTALVIGKGAGLGVFLVLTVVLTVVPPLWAHLPRMTFTTGSLAFAALIAGVVIVLLVKVGLVAAVAAFVLLMLAFALGQRPPSARPEQRPEPVHTTTPGGTLWDVSNSAEIEAHRGERAVRLRSCGFESCTVRGPSWDMHHSLDWYFRHPARVNASTFATEVIAVSLVPARTAQEVARLSEHERGRLRVAVIAACGREREWRRLHGSHLTADERLMAVLVWRWREHQRLLARLRERGRELDAAVETVSGVVVGVQSVSDRLLKSMSMMSKMLNPVAGYSKALSSFLGAPKLPYQFPDPAQQIGARTVRLYSDPSPLVLSAAGGADSFVWSKHFRSVLGLGEPAWMKTVRKMSDDLLGTKTMQLALGNLSLMHGAAPAGLPGMLGPSSSALALLRLPASHLREWTISFGATASRCASSPSSWRRSVASWTGGSNGHCGSCSHSSARTRCATSRG